jgi:hypothetical protein
VSSSSELVGSRNSPYRRVAMSGFAGIQWMPTQRWSLGMRLLANRQYQSVTDQYVSESQPPANWQTDLQIRYFLF